MGFLFVVSIVIFWTFTELFSKKINEEWVARYVNKQIVFDKYRTLTPILSEKKLVLKMAQEPSIISMAKDESNPEVYNKGIETLENYRQLFNDRSYFAAFTKSNHYFYNDATNKYDGKQLQYTLSQNNVNDSWFYVSMNSVEDVSINVDKDHVLGVTKVWINCVIKDNGKKIGVIGTGFDFDKFIKESVALEQDGVKNYFIDDQMAIQLAKETSMIDYASFTHKDGEHKTIDELFDDPEDLSKIRTLMKSISQSFDKNQVLTTWAKIDSKSKLIGIAYLPEIGWYNLTVIDADELSIFDNQYMFVFLVVILLVFLVYLNHVHNKLFLKPLNKLKMLMQKIKDDEHIDVEVVGTGEIAQLSVQFKAMVEYIRHHHSILENKIKERTLELAKSEEKYRDLVENVAGEYFFYSHDRDGNFTYLSDSVKTILGYTPDEMMKHYESFLTDNPINNKVAEYTEKTFQGIEHPPYIVSVRDKNGNECFIEVKETPVKNSDDVVEAIVAIAHDVTQTVCAQQVLANEREKLNSLINDMGERFVVYSHDLEGLMLYVSNGVKTVFGISSSDILGKNFKEAINWSGDSLKLAAKADLYVKNNKGKSYQHEMSFIHPNGEERFLAVTSHAGYDMRNSVDTIDGIVEDITERKAMALQIQQQAITDQLTGLYNRHKINETLSNEIDRSARYAEPLCIGIFDVDHFKQVNDTYGHLNGDKALIAIATILKEHIRKSDIVGRWGGEEFIIIAPHVDIDNMKSLAEKIRKTIEEYKFIDMKSITVSFGLTPYLKDDTNQSLLARADEALYEAKRTGRNRIVVH